MTVHVRGLDLVVGVRGGGGDAHRDLGEVPRRRGAADAAGQAFAPVQTWTDPDDRFALTLAAAVEGDEQIIE